MGFVAVPKSPNFGGVSRHFQAKLVKCKKRAYYRNFCIDSNHHLVVFITVQDFLRSDLYLDDV